MARKRLISPEIWESQSFGELTILAKILFIGMISQADDDGKGILSAQFLKSRILPYNKAIRIADVDKALKEIGHKTSTIYYEVYGKKYYIFENWQKWQMINCPTPSKLPDPPEIVWGKGGELRSEDLLTEYSLNTHGILTERIEREERREKNKKEKETKRIEEEKRRIEEREEKKRNALARTLTREEVSLLKSNSITVDLAEIPTEVDLQVLVEKVNSSSYLKQWEFLSKYVNHYEKIKNGYYDTYLGANNSLQSSFSGSQHNYTAEQLKGAFMTFDEDSNTTWGD